MAGKVERQRLLDVLVPFPWWMSTALSVGTYVMLGIVVPAVSADAAVSTTLSDLAGPFALVLLGPALVSIVRRWHQGRLPAANRTPSISRLAWKRFEELLKTHYRDQGFHIDPGTAGGPDEGTDLRIRTRRGRWYLVQCKQWRSARVGVKVVRELYGVVVAEGAAGGTVVTTGSVHRGSRPIRTGPSGRTGGWSPASGHAPGRQRGERPGGRVHRARPRHLTIRPPRAAAAVQSYSGTLSTGSGPGGGSRCRWIDRFG